MSESSKFWVSREGQNYGPYSLEELKTYVEQGHFCGEDSACEAKEGANWKSVGDFTRERKRTARLDESDFYKGSSSNKKSTGLDERDFYKGASKKPQGSKPNQSAEGSSTLESELTPEETEKTRKQILGCLVAFIFAIAFVVFAIFSPSSGGHSPEWYDGYKDGHTVGKRIFRDSQNIPDIEMLHDARKFHTKNKSDDYRAGFDEAVSKRSEIWELSEGRTR